MPPKMWGTPKAQDSRHATWDRGKCNLGEQVSGLHDGGALNPTWTEWLMGWPLEWSDLKPLATDKCHCAQQQHLNCLEQGLEATPAKVEHAFIAKMFGYNDTLPDPKADKIYTEKDAVPEPKEHHRHVRHYPSGASLSHQYSILGV